MWRRGKSLTEIARGLDMFEGGNDPTHKLRTLLRLMHRAYHGANGHTYRLPYRISRRAVANSRLVGRSGRSLRSLARQARRAQGIASRSAFANGG